MKLREIAHSRTGDKGNISVISVIAYKKEDYPWILEHVTARHVQEYFKEIVHGKVTRYELPGIAALNFVMEDALGGGVTRSLALDMHGKTLSGALLEMELPKMKESKSGSIGNRATGCGSAGAGVIGKRVAE